MLPVEKPKEWVVDKVYIFQNVYSEHNYKMKNMEMYENVPSMIKGTYERTTNDCKAYPYNG